MARGRAATYDVQRDAILVHAAELFARKGYAATSMIEVARACGLSKPALYHYFRDKDALLVEIAETHVRRLHELVDDIAAMDLAPRARLERLILRFVEEYADAQHAHRVLTEDTRFMAEADRERVLGHERAVVASFARAVAEVRPDLDTARLTKPLAMLLFGMINWMFTWLKRDGAFDHATMAPVVADLFLAGLPGVRVPAVDAAPARRRAVRDPSPALSMPVTAPVPAPAPAPAPAPQPKPRRKTILTRQA
jgi:TetR/AcrR family transcriptional regulator